MGKHVQRKRFGHPASAAEQAAEFMNPHWKVPGIALTANAVEINGEYWVYVTREGEIVTGQEPLLPDYEKAD